MKTNKLLALLLVVALAVMLCVTAFAADDDPANPTTEPVAEPATSSIPSADSSSANLVKYLVIPDGATVPTVENKFKFEPNQAASSTGVSATELADATPGTDGVQTITINSTNAKIPAHREGNSVYLDAALASLNSENTPLHAGVYAYTVTETAADYNGSGEIVKSAESYIVRYYVKTNASGQAVVDEITVQKGTDASAKVDPNVDDPTENDDSSTTEIEITGFTFTNTYRLNNGDNTYVNAPLKVSKTVEGKENDTTKFPIAITLTKAVGAADTVLQASIYNADGTMVAGSTKNVPYGTETMFDITTGQTVAILTMPVGTKYTTSEKLANATDYNAYVPSVESKSGTTTDFSVTGTQGQTLDGQSSDLLIEQDVKDTVAYTNTYDSQIDTPTGILMNNLPYIILILVVLGGLTGYVLSKRRREQE